MIFIKKNQVNKVVLTLSETSRLTNPNWLFVFQNEYNLEAPAIHWSQVDISTSPNRYNLFELIESDFGELTGGTQSRLNLVPGQYSYTTYESTGQTLSISATTGMIIESGRMVVESDGTDENQIITNNTFNIYS